MSVFSSFTIHRKQFASLFILLLRTSAILSMNTECLKIRCCFFKVRPAYAYVSVRYGASLTTMVGCRFTAAARLRRFHYEHGTL